MYEFIYAWMRFQDEIIMYHSYELYLYKNEVIEMR
jgi:hypothetical protein